MLLYLIAIAILYLIYSQCQMHADHKTIIHNQKTIWFAIEDVNELTAKIQKPETPDGYYGMPKSMKPDTRKE